MPKKTLRHACTTSWLKHCAISRKVVGSIPKGVTGIFYWRNPSGRTMALGSPQPLTEMSTRNISWGLRRSVLGANNLTTFKGQLSWNLGATTSGNLRACLGRYRNLFIFYSLICRPQWPRGLRCWSASACLLRLWVRIPPGLQVFVTGHSLSHKSPTKCGVSEWHLEPSKVRKPMSPRVVKP